MSALKTVKRRTFAAAKFPEGSPERLELNLSAVTSEYYTSQRYCVCDENGNSFGGYRTKSEAELHCK